MSRPNDWSHDKAERVLRAILDLADKGIGEKNEFVVRSAGVKAVVPSNLGALVPHVFATLRALRLASFHMHEHPFRQALEWSGAYVLTRSQLSKIKEMMQTEIPT